MDRRYQLLLTIDYQLCGLGLRVQLPVPTRMDVRGVEYVLFKEQGTHINSFINEPKLKANRFIM